MKCPECKAWAEVKETRPRQDGSKRRTYICANLHRFHTVERVEKVTWGGARKRKETNEHPGIKSQSQVR